MPKISSLIRRFSDRYREDGARATAQAAGRNILRAALYRLGDDSNETGKALQNIDFSSYTNGQDTDEIRTYDVILATDLRFPGGSSSSSAQEILIQAQAGHKSGLFHLPTYKMRNRSSPAPVIDAVIRGGHADILNPCTGPLRTRVLLFRHPAILNPNGVDLPDIDAEEVGLIINHPPIKFGQIEYLLPYAIRELRQKYGKAPHVFPIGPLIRQQINEIYDGTITLATEDWVNVFDLERFSTNRLPPVGRPLRIGRHSRPNVEKWPQNPEDIRAAYPDQTGIEVHILGGGDIPERLLGGLPSNWIVHEFGEMDPAKFLKKIDVFVYFHHPDWVEAFGRVILEAMAAGLPVILPPHFEPLLGNAGIYCMPDDVLAELQRLRDPDYYMYKSEISRETAIRRFNPTVHLDRIAALSRLAAGEGLC